MQNSLQEVRNYINNLYNDNLFFLGEFIHYIYIQHERMYVERKKLYIIYLKDYLILILHFIPLILLIFNLVILR